MTIHEHMWSVVGKDIEGCVEALRMQADELAETPDPIRVRAISMRVQSIARRLRTLSDFKK